MKYIWKHKKFKSAFIGFYERDSKGERVFVLISMKEPLRRITFESWQMAKSQGWHK